MPLISIVTVVRNDEAGLGKTRASVASQSFRDFEWLVIDGASTDGTAALALSFREPYVAVTSEPDGGIFDAMNKGLDRAAGEFILFLNAGDILSTGSTLARVADSLSTHAVDFLYGDSFEAFGGARVIYKTARGHGGVNYGMFGCHQAMYYRRSLIGAQRYDPLLRVAGDYGFTAQFLTKHPRIERVGEALCIFDLTGISVVNKRRGRQENWHVQREVLKLPLIRRCIIRIAYVCSAFMAERLPFVYRKLRFRRPHGN